jgi:hypothetical protein
MIPRFTWNVADFNPCSRVQKHFGALAVKPHLQAGHKLTYAPAITAAGLHFVASLQSGGATGLLLGYPTVRL